MFSQPDVALIGGYSNILQDSRWFRLLKHLLMTEEGRLAQPLGKNHSSTAFPFKYELLWRLPQISGSVNTLSAVHMTKQ